MSIYYGSRYETATLAAITDAESNQNVVSFRGPSPLAPALSAGLYTVQPGDRIDALAYRFYQREDYYWVIADANPIVPFYPLTPGAQITIPNVVG